MRHVSSPTPSSFSSSALPVFVVPLALVIVIVVILYRANNKLYTQGEGGDVGHPCASFNAYLRLGKEIRQHSLRFTMTLMPAVFSRIEGRALEVRRRHNGLWLRYDWGTLHYSPKSRRATFYVDDLEGFREFVSEAGLELPRSVRAELAIPVYDMWPDLEGGKVLVRGSDGQTTLVYFDRSQGYTELELRGDYEQSLRLAKLLVYPSLETQKLLQEIRDNVRALAQMGTLPVLNAIQDLFSLSSRVLQQQQELIELLKQDKTKEAKRRSKVKVTFDDLPADVKARIDLLIEKGIAYCSQYRVYPTKRFMMYVKHPKGN